MARSEADFLRENVEFCLEEWGQPTERIPADEAALERLRRYVPKHLIGLWRALGFSVFKNGLMTIVNPLDWKPVIDEWIAGTELFDLDTFVPLIKGAYGDFRLFGLEYGCSVTLMPAMGSFVGTRDKAQVGLNIAVSGYFGEAYNTYDYYKKACGFDKALAKLGPLKANEIYGFVPVLPLGGTEDLAHLQKLDAFAHLSILRQATGELRGIMEYGDIYK